MFDPITIKDTKIKLGTLCKKYRQRHQLTRDNLADAIHVSRTTIQNFENGKNATLDTALKIAYHFDLLEDFYRTLEDLETDTNIESLY